MKNKCIAFIPVRAGSQGIPNKNIKDFCGQPLVYWTAKAANDSKYVDKVYVSTDNEEIKSLVESFNLPKVEVVSRSHSVSTDIASTESVMLEFVEKHDFENIILIQATSPLLTSQDLNNAILRYEKNKFDSILSVVRQKRFLWKINNKFLEPVNYDYFKRPRRQDFEGFLVENGAFYLTSRERLLKYKCRISGKIGYFEMHEDSYYEIDSLNDWIVAENLKFKQIQNNIKNLSNFKNINLLICDVDGVLTDGAIYYAKDAEKLKKFNTKDGKGIELIKTRGIQVMFLTGENSGHVKKRANKLKIDYVCVGVENKLDFLNKFFRQYKNYSFEKTAYIGDDINDLEAMKSSYFSSCPADASSDIKNVVKYLCVNKGGNGCVREICNLIVNGQNV